MQTSTHSSAPWRGLSSPIGAAKPRKTRRRIRAGKKSRGFHDQEDELDQAAADRPADWTQAITRFAGHLVDQEKSDHTQKNYREDLLAFTDWYQKTYQERPDLRALAPSELREWKAHLRDALKLEPATVNRKLAALRSFLRWAAAEGLAPEMVAPKSIKQVKPPPRWLDRKEQRA